jgi:TPR repeat protein
VKWFRLAAEKSNAGAQYKLGIMYANGLGAPQDYVRAHVVQLVSRAGASNCCAKRDSLAKGMTPEQIAEAQKLAHEWQPKPP